MRMTEYLFHRNSLENKVGHEYRVLFVFGRSRRGQVIQDIFDGRLHILFVSGMASGSYQRREVSDRESPKGDTVVFFRDKVLCPTGDAREFSVVGEKTKVIFVDLYPMPVQNGNDEEVAQGEEVAEKECMLRIRAWVRPALSSWFPFPWRVLKARREVLEEAAEDLFWAIDEYGRLSSAFQSRLAENVIGTLLQKIFCPNRPTTSDEQQAETPSEANEDEKT